MNPNANGCYYTFLRICQELEDKKIGGFGGYDAKPMLLEIKDKGIDLLATERELIQSTMNAIKVQLKELSKQSDGDRQAIKDAVKETITKTIQDEMQTTPADFYIRKKILVDGAYANDEITMFLSGSVKKEVGKQVVCKTLRNRGYRFSDTFFDNEDLLDIDIILLLIDFAFEVIDEVFFNECLGVEEDLFGTVEAEIDVSDVSEHANFDSVDEAINRHASNIEAEATEQSYTPSEQPSYTPPEPDRSSCNYGSDNDYSSSYDSGSCDCSSCDCGCD